MQKQFFILLLVVATRVNSSFCQVTQKADSIELILSSVLHDSSKANSLFKIISDINSSKNYELAKNNSKKALEYFSRKKDMLSYVKLSELYGDAYAKLKNYDSAIYVFKNSTELANRFNDNEKKPLMAKFYTKIGKVFERVSYDSSIIYYAKSHDIYKSFKNNNADSMMHVNGLSMLAYSHLMTGNPKVGYEIAEQAAKMADNMSDNRMKSLSYSVLGTILSELNLFDKAISTLRFAAQAGITANDSARAGASYNSIALVYLKQDNYKDALKYYYKALEYINKNNSPFQYATICYNTIYALCELDSVNRAEYFLNELTGKISNIKTDVNYFGTLIVVCNYYAKKGNLLKADEYMQKATEILPSFNSNEQLSQYYSIKAALLAAKGDYRKSLEYYKLYKGYEDSISARETQEMVAEKNTIYETEKKQQQIILLQKDNELRAANELRAKQIRNFSFAGIAALIVFGGFTYYRYKQRKQLSEKLSLSLTELKAAQQQLIKTERLMEQENVRLRISRDIHDEIGSSLTKIALLSELASDEVLSKPAETKESLQSIADYSRNVNASLGEIVWAVNPQQDTLDRLLAYMRNYIHTFLDRTGINFKINFPEVEENRHLNPDLKRNIFLVLKESLNNAVKYSKAKNINIDFVLNENQFEFSVKDDGIGIDTGKESISGTGLNNMKYRMEQSGCNLNITSSAGNGCIIFAHGNLG